MGDLYEGMQVSAKLRTVVERSFRLTFHLRTDLMAFHKRVEQLLTPRKGVLQLSSRVCRFTLGERSIGDDQAPRATWEVQESALDPGWA
eukprot:5622215-Alexandrium_andersonii.AAC.1